MTTFDYNYQNSFRFCFVIEICQSRWGLKNNSPNLHKKTTNWRILVVVVKWCHRAIVLLPPSFSDNFSENNTIHSCNTRSANKVYIKYERTNYRRFSVRYRGAMIWNSLPNSLKEIKSLQLFKRKLKCFFSRNILTPHSGTYIKCNTLNSY